MTGLDQLKPSIEKMRCLIALHKKMKAKQICLEVIIKLINSADFTEDLKEIYPTIDKELLDVLTALQLDTKSDHTGFSDIILPLSRATIRIVQVYYDQDSEKKLTKLLELGSVLKDWNPIIDKKNNTENIVEEKMEFLNKILEDMQNITGVDIKCKSLLIASFLSDIGKLYQNLQEFSRCTINHEKAIALIRTIGGKDSEQWTVLGKCYLELGIAYQENMEVKKAKVALQKAKIIFERSTDIFSDEKHVMQSKVFRELTSLELNQKLVRRIALWVARNYWTFLFRSLLALIVVVFFLLYFGLLNLDIALEKSDSSDNDVGVNFDEIKRSPIPIIVLFPHRISAFWQKLIQRIFDEFISKIPCIHFPYV